MTDTISTPDTSACDPAYIVVLNHEEQYSIWPAEREIPGGWSAVEIPADWAQHHRERYPEHDSKRLCLAYIEEVWNDMRPLSVRRAAEKYALNAHSGGKGHDASLLSNSDTSKPTITRSLI